MYLYNRITYNISSKYWLKSYLQIKWRYSWIIDEGGWKILFTLIFICLIFIWWPFLNFNKLIVVRPLTDEDFEDQEKERKENIELSMGNGQGIGYMGDDDNHSEVEKDDSNRDSNTKEPVTRVASAIED